MIVKKVDIWKVLFALSIIIMFGFLLVSDIAFADESDSWIIPDNSYNEYQEIKSTVGDYVVQQGKHPRGTSNILYRTTKYCMTLDKVSITYSSTGAFDSVNKQFIPVDVDNDPSGAIVTTTYTMKKSIFIDAMQNLGVTSKMIKNNGGSITVYIHNIFNLYNPNTGADYSNYTNILGYKEMMEAGDRITGYNGGWPSATKEALKYYYNFPYVVTPTIFNVEVLAVEKGTGKVLGTLKTGDVGMLGETYPSSGSYTAPATFTSGGASYTSSGEWYSKYIPRGSSDEIDGKVYTGIRIISNYALPDAAKDSTVKLCVVYDRPASAKIVINAIDNNDVVMKQLYTGTVSPSEYKSEVVDTIVPYGGYNYQKTVNYYYTYINTHGVKSSKIKDATVLANDPITLTIPSDIGANTTITVNVYYDKTVSGAIPVNIFAVDKDTDKTIKTIGSGSVAGGATYTYPDKIADSFTYSSSTYQYSGTWDWSYVLSSTSSILKTNATGTTITFLAPSTSKITGGITVKVYYTKNSAGTTPIPTPTPTPSVPAVEVPMAAAPISLALDSPTPYAIINGDKYSSPYFNSELGISTTESQYVYVKTKDYLLGYTLINRTGKVTYTVPVTMKYTITYYSAPNQEGVKTQKTVVESDTQYIPVERAYSYWEITNLEYYYVNKANIYNYSLPDGGVLLTANNSYLNIPSLVTSHSSTLTDHVAAPSQVSAGITLFKTISSGGSTKPTYTRENLTYYALTQTEESTVKNDYIVFGGSVVMSNTPVKKIAPRPDASRFVQSTTIIPDKTLYTEGKVIDALKINGVYPSNGTVTYPLNPMSVNSLYSQRSYTVSVNKVTVHTPVICLPEIAADNDEWVQLKKPTDDAVEIVLDPDTNLNDFTVKISNTLHHSSRPGYYTRDFSRSYIDPENISYIAKKEGIVRNEMKLPFDVYIDTKSDGKDANDEFIKSGTWIILGRTAHRFYLPMWVQEGTYTAQFRTIAVNGTDKLDKTETTRNSDISNYVATATQTFEISGRIYGLTIYDLSDYPTWEEVFRKKDTMLFKLFEGNTDGTEQISYGQNYAYYYTVGTKNQYGINTARYSKFTIPLVNGSHPKYSNRGVLKTGYAARFMLDTTGEMYSSGCQVKITPTFYFVDKDGNNRQQVDLYYKEEINNKSYSLVKVGAGIDLVNIKKGTTDNIYSRLPAREIKQTANVMDTTYSKIANQISTMYSYSQIKLLKAFRTFIGLDYASNIAGLSSWNDVKDNTGQTQTNLSKYMQRWYGTYKLPNDVHPVATGYDVFGYMKKHGIDYQENFWLKDGYIIVNFNIVTIDKNGKERLSYINGSNYLNNGNCSMWVTEGGILQKTDNKKATFDFKAGDFIIYYSSKKSTDDYTGHLY